MRNPSSWRIVAQLIVPLLVAACGGGATGSGIGGGGGGPNLSGNAFLENLVLSCVDTEQTCGQMQLVVDEELDLPPPPPGFQPGADAPPLELRVYTSVQSNLVDAITVTPTVINPGATVTVNGVAVANRQASGPITLPVGETEIEIVVTAVNRQAQLTYRIGVTRLADDVADLSALSVALPTAPDAPLTLDPEFRSDRDEYGTAVPAFTNGSVLVTASSTEPAARIEINGALTAQGAARTIQLGQVGDNVITVTVVPLSGAAKDYVLTIVRPGSAELSGITIQGLTASSGHYCGGVDEIPMTLVPRPSGNPAPFDPATTAYQTQAESRVERVCVTPVISPPLEAGATVEVRMGDFNETFDPGETGQPMTSGPIALEDVGGNRENEIEIHVLHQVSAQATPLERIYTLTVVSQDPPLFEPEAYLKPPPAVGGLEFGSAVVIAPEGDLMLVGAPGEDHGGRPGVGRVHIFARNNGGAGDWVYEDALDPPDSLREDARFGTAIALHRDGATGSLTIAVGAPGQPHMIDPEIGDEQIPLENSGLGFVFTGSNIRNLVKQARFEPIHPWLERRFGEAVALSPDGRTLAIGEPGEPSDLAGIVDRAAVTEADIDGSDSMGAVHIYGLAEEGENPWTPGAIIKAPPRVEGSSSHRGAEFGASLAIGDAGGVLAIGMPGEGSDASAICATGVTGAATGTAARNNGSGAVYIYHRNGEDWQETAEYIRPCRPATNSGYRFGSSVALSAVGNMLAVGSQGHNNATLGVWNRVGTSFLDLLQAQSPSGVNSRANSGAAYVFSRNNDGDWVQDTFIKPSNTRNNFFFGQSVALSANGDLLVVGARGENSAANTVDGNELLAGANTSGAAYVYVRDEDTGVRWAKVSFIKVPNSRAGVAFGTSVAIATSEGAPLLVGGASGEPSPSSAIISDPAQFPTDGGATARGAVYTFEAVGPVEFPEEPEEPEDPEDPEDPGDPEP